MFVRVNFVDIYLQGMRDRSMRSGTELAREIQLTDWSTAGNLSNRSSGVQIPHDICTRFGRYLYSVKCSWIINVIYSFSFDVFVFYFNYDSEHGNIWLHLNWLAIYLLIVTNESLALWCKHGGVVSPELNSERGSHSSHSDHQFCFMVELCSTPHPCLQTSSDQSSYRVEIDIFWERCESSMENFVVILNLETIF